jgi:hypothetical protein
LKDTKNILFVRKLRFHLSTERKENDFVDQNWCGQWEIIGKKLFSVMRGSVISPKLCLLSERSIRYIILSSRTPVFLPLPLRGKFSSDSRTRRLLRNLLIVLLFREMYSRLPWMSPQNGRRHLRKFLSNFLLLIKSVLFTFD